MNVAMDAASAMARPAGFQSSGICQLSTTTFKLDNNCWRGRGRGTRCTTLPLGKKVVLRCGGGDGLSRRTVSENRTRRRPGWEADGGACGGAVGASGSSLSSKPSRLAVGVESASVETFWYLIARMSAHEAGEGREARAWAWQAHGPGQRTRFSSAAWPTE